MYTAPELLPPSRLEPLELLLVEDEDTKLLELELELEDELEGLTEEVLLGGAIHTKGCELLLS